jgi:hypothetical protein
MTIPSDEDKLIEALKAHKALKQWTMKTLQTEGIDCTETYGNDPRGDIRLNEKGKMQQAQSLLANTNTQVNPDASPQEVLFREVEDPHLEIKTRYIYGKEVDRVIDKQTIIGLVSASRISQIGKQKFNASGIVFAENIPEPEFMPEE